MYSDFYVYASFACTNSNLHDLIFRHFVLFVFQTKVMQPEMLDGSEVPVLTFSDSQLLVFLIPNFLLVKLNASSLQ